MVAAKPAWIVVTLNADNIMNLKQHLLRQMAFSHATFGPGARREGVVDHIKQELQEVLDCEEHEAAPEWVDVVLLGLDGLTRELAFQCGDDTREHAEDVVEMACQYICAKQNKNESRVWPDWRTIDKNKAIGHVE